MKAWYRAEDLTDLTSVPVPSLDRVDPAQLEEVTSVTAAKQNYPTTATKYSLLVQRNLSQHCVDVNV